jgi:hypothetical protein
MHRAAAAKRKRCAAATAAAIKNRDRAAAPSLKSIIQLMNRPLWQIDYTTHVRTKADITASKLFFGDIERSRAGQQLLSIK